MPQVLGVAKNYGGVREGENVPHFVQSFSPMYTRHARSRRERRQDAAAVNFARQLVDARFLCPEFVFVSNQQRSVAEMSRKH